METNLQALVSEQTQILADFRQYLVDDGKADRTIQSYRIDIETAVFEYIDGIVCDDGQIYASALVLLGSDNGIVLIMPLQMLPRASIR